MTPYQMEQMTCHEMVRNHLAVVSEYELELLKTMADDYLSFRHAVSSFLSDHFNLICDSKCYGNRLSACCSKDGIITFFADIAINALISSELDLNRLMTALQRPHEGFKCVYLGANGCLWRLKPIVCEMFLCDDATEKAFADNDAGLKKWDDLTMARKRFTWPDQPILFDELEQFFLDAGHHSPLMYLHNSPGLLRVKEAARENAGD